MFSKKLMGLDQHIKTFDAWIALLEPKTEDSDLLIELRANSFYDEYTLCRATPEGKIRSKLHATPHFILSYPRGYLYFRPPLNQAMIDYIDERIKSDSDLEGAGLYCFGFEIRRIRPSAFVRG